MSGVAAAVFSMRHWRIRLLRLSSAAAPAYSPRMRWRKFDATACIGAALRHCTSARTGLLKSMSKSPQSRETAATLSGTVPAKARIFDRQLLRQRRDRAVAHFDDHDFLIAEIAERLLDRLD